MTSPAIDFKAIVTALGARFTAATMGTPTGADAIRKVYPQSAKSVPALPAIILEVQHGTLLANAGTWEHHMFVDAILLLAKRPGDPVRVETERQLYLPFLLHATEDAIKIGIGAQTHYEVKSAQPTGWEWTEYAVAAEEFDAIRVNYEVWVYETVTLTP